MTTAKLIPMETEFPYAPGMHRKSLAATAGVTQAALDALQCGDTKETLCDDCKAKQHIAVYIFAREDLKDGRQWKNRVRASSPTQARQTLSKWAGKTLRHIY